MRSGSSTSPEFDSTSSGQKSRTRSGWSPSWSTLPIGLSTNDMMHYFDQHSIDTRPFLPPLSSLAAFSSYDTVSGAAERNPVAYDIAARSINLPSALMLDESQVDRVCAHLRELLASRKEL